MIKFTEEEKKSSFIVIAGENKTKSYTQNPLEIEGIITMMKSIHEKDDIDFKNYKNDDGEFKLVDTIHHYAVEEHDYCPKCNSIMESDKITGNIICPECDFRLDQD